MNSPKPLRWKAVDSSAISHLAYVRGRRGGPGTLYIRFKETMDEYRFEMVPWATFCALYRAPSIGRAFNIQIRPIFTGIKHEESS